MTSPSTTADDTTGSSIADGAGERISAPETGSSPVTSKASYGSAPSFTTAVLFVAACTVAHLIFAARADLIPDETYYWLWSRFPAAGYFDHPPMVAYWIAAGTGMFGDSALAIRLFSVLSIPVVSLAVYFTARTLFEEAGIASRAVIWVNLMVLIALGGAYAVPDAPSVLFWSLATFAFAKVVKTGDAKWWLAVGLFAGLGAASKYTNLFFGLAVLLWLLVDRRSRGWLATPWPYAGGLIAVVVFLPVFLWNADHGWDSFKYQFGRIGGGHLNVSSFSEFIGGQFLLANPFVAILAGAAVVAWLQRRQPAAREVAFVVATVTPFLAYLVFHSIRARVEGNWPSPAYPGLALLAAVAAAGALPRWLTFVRAAVVPFGIGVAVVGMGLVTLPAEGILARIDPKSVGWSGLAAAVDDAMAANGAGWVAAIGYSTVSELAYHLRPIPVIEINDRKRFAFEGSTALPAGPAILVQPESGAFDLSTCFAKIRRIGTFQRLAPESTANYALWAVEEPAAGLLAEGCGPSESR